jgi:protein tyrosine phosphatase
VGRTGTFIAMSIFKKIIDEKLEVSVFETVRQLREQRWGMVYTFSQYEFLYDWVDQLIMEKKNKEIENDESGS